MEITKVLMVDDDPDIRRIGMIALERVGLWRAREAASGAEALAAVADFGPDVILLDVMMPALDGPTTYARLRDAGLLAHPRVIFMTAKSMRHELDAYLALGAAGVILKPFDPLTLPSEIRAIVARSDAAGP